MCKECSTRSTRTLLIAGNGARHEQHRLAAGSLLSPADMTGLSEQAHHPSDRRDVLECEWRPHVRPCLSFWVKGHLRGMHLSYKKPAKCVKEFHSPQQHAITQRLFIKLCWLMDKHAVSADHVVNVDETSCNGKEEAL